MEEPGPEASVQDVDATLKKQDFLGALQALNLNGTVVGSGAAVAHMGAAAARHGADPKATCTDAEKFRWHKRVSLIQGAVPVEELVEIMDDNDEIERRLTRMSKARRLTTLSTKFHSDGSTKETKPENITETRSLCDTWDTNLLSLDLDDSQHR